MGAVLRLVLTFVLLVGLPLAGAWAAGLPLDVIFEFPPRTQHVQHAGFSWVAFALYAAFILAWVLPFAAHALRGRAGVTRTPARGRFPRWGWLALGLGATAWVLAWTRLPWTGVLQRHTFLPLWIAYILVMNALTLRRTGRCLMQDRPRFFLLLFPCSALFWWFFEYLNRYVQNWVYAGVTYDPLEYVVTGSLCFSTVLAAVLSTQQWLLSFPAVEKFRSFSPVLVRRPRTFAGLVLAVAAAGLVCIGVFPNHLFGLLWVSPLLVIVCLQALWGERHVFSAVSRGDWRGVVSAAVAALVCGWFWEMWNYYGLAKWQYQVPFVARFHVFEMPVLGYAGYLPFGLECVAVAGILSQLVARGDRERLT